MFAKNILKSIIDFLFKWFPNTTLENELMGEIRETLEFIRKDFGIKTDIYYYSGEEGDSYYRINDPTSKLEIIVWPELYPKYKKSRIAKESDAEFKKEFKRYISNQKKTLHCFIEADGEATKVKIREYLKKLAQKFGAELFEE